MIDKKLFKNLIRSSYQQSTIRVRCGVDGNLSNPNQMEREVHQSCILVPTLFNLYLNDLSKGCLAPEYHSPKLDKINVSLLLHGDDVVLMSVSEIGLKRIICVFLSYCKNSSLTVSFDKTKILFFSQYSKTKNWVIESQWIEQVKKFKYVVITFSRSISWSYHRQSAVQVANNTSKLLR